MARTAPSNQSKLGPMARTNGHRVGDCTDSDVVGAVPVVHTISCPDAATASYDVVLDYKTEILDVVVQKRAGAGGASDTVQIKNSGTAISDAISINVADKVIARAGTIDDAQSVIAAGGTLRVTVTKVSANNVACLVTVYGVRRA